MLSRNDELDVFKRDVNLAELAASYGYKRDPAKSTRHTYSMTDEQGNHLVISVNPSTGHWRWFNPLDPEKESGTVVDFVQTVEQVSLGEVRKMLRAWLRMPAPTLRDYQNPKPLKRVGGTLKPTWLDFLPYKIRRMPNPVGSPRQRCLPPRRFTPGS